MSTSNNGFSWFEYQLLALTLGGAMCIALALLEGALRKYQILPLLYNGMFTVKKRRINCFNIDITDEPMGKGIRCRAKMNLRLTMCVVLSYLWQFCVIEYVINSQGDFPGKECRSGYDCYSSPLKFKTIFTRDMDPIDCDNEGLFNPNGDEQLIVNCMKLVEPNAANWLMHIAISHSLWLLVTKSFELSVWMASGNQALSKFMLILLIVYTIAAIVLFFGGFLLDFASSWIGFVVTLSFPIFIAISRQTALLLRELRREEIMRIRASEYADFGTAVEVWTATTAVTQDNQNNEGELGGGGGGGGGGGLPTSGAAGEESTRMDDDDSSSLNEGAEGMRKRVNKAMQKIFNNDNNNEITLDIGIVNVQLATVTNNNNKQ